MKMKMKRYLGILLTLALVLGLMPGMTMTAQADGSIKYIDGNGDSHTTDTYTVVTSGTNSFADGWYVVSATVTNNNRIKVTGTAHLILCDGATLKASKGIQVASGNTLNIYTGSTDETVQGNGALLINSVDDENAGIGGNRFEAGGTVTIHGGKVTVTGGDHGAGIGGGVLGAGGKVTINGGEVTVTGGDYGAGIGGSYEGNGGEVTINGGIVNVTGRTWSAGIGGGYNGAGGNVTINGGEVTATGDDGGVGIGAGSYGGNNGSLGVDPNVGMLVSTDNKNWSAYDATAGTRMQYMKTGKIHAHSFTYSASGATITATCSNTDGKCTLDDGTAQHNHAVSLTLSATDASYTGSAYTGASLSDTTAWTGAGLTAPTIEYVGRGSTSYTKSTTAPTNAGTYTASITEDTDKTATADFTIAKAPITVSGIAVNQKEYDGTTDATLNYGSVTFGGKVGEDKLEVTATGTFADAGIGNNKDVTISNLTLGGDDAANYVLASTGQQDTAQGNITPRAISVKPKDQTVEVGMSVSSLPKDVELTGTGTLLSGHSIGEVTVSGDTSALTTSGTLKISAVKIEDGSGTDVSNLYSIDQTSTGVLTVLGAEVYISGLAAGNKTYDGNVTATLTGTAGLKRASNDETISGLTVSNVTAEFSDKNAGNGKTVSVTGGSLSDTTNYSLNLDKTNEKLALTANITPLAVTVADLAATNRDYEPENLTVELTGGTVTGKIGEDAVTVDLTDAAGTMADADAGTDKTVTVTGVKLTGNDAGNYTLSAQPTGLTVTINQAVNPAKVAETASVKRGGNTLDLKDLVTLNGATGTIEYGLNPEKAGGCTLSGSILTSGQNVGTAEVLISVGPDKNHLGLEVQTVAVTISDKNPQKVFFASAAVTKTYGDAAFTNAATTTGDGAITYEVAEGKEFVTIDKTSGKVTILKAGNALIRATAAETMNYDAASATYTLTIEKAEPEVTAPKGKTLTYSGSAQELIEEGSTKDGTISYAMTTTEAAPAAEAFGEVIPSGTETGTYYVWYKVTGDDNHKDTKALPVTASILPVDRDSLNKLIGEAEDYLETIKEKYPDIARDLETAINEAKETAENPNAKAEEIAEQIRKLTEALEKAKKAVKDAEDQAAAKAVKDLIDALPDADKVTINDKTAIEAARKAYDALTDAQKKLIPADVLKKLTDDEEALANLDVKAVINQINALPDADKVTINDKEAIEAARKAYDALTAEKKQLVPAEVLKKLTDDEAALKGKSISYTTYEGEGGEYKHGSDGTLTFVFKRSENDSETFARFTGLKYDGRSLTRDKDYTAKAGSVIITLDHELLESMMVGNHILTAVFDDGEADAHFTVIANAEPTATPTAAPTATPTPTPTPKPVPKTGDNSNPALWLAMMILGILCIGGVVFRMVRKRG